MPGDIVASDGQGEPDGIQTIFKIDPVTGDRTIISDENTGTGPIIEAADSVVVDRHGRILVTDFVLDVIFRVDPVSGNRTILSGAGKGSGPNLTGPQGIDLGSDGSIFVTDHDGILGPGAVYRIDPFNGNRTVVMSTGMSSIPSDIAVADDGFLFVIDTAQSVFKINPATGAFTLVPSGTGPNYTVPDSIVIDSTGDLLVSNVNPDLLLRVDPVSGDRTILSDAGTGTGPNFSHPGDLAIEETGDLLVAENFQQRLFRVDPITGDRVILSDASNGTGPLLNISGIAIVPDFTPIPEPSTFTLGPHGHGNAELSRQAWA